MQQNLDTYYLQMNVIKGSVRNWWALEMDHIFTARCYAERGIATASGLSVCLSVPLYVRDVRWCIMIT